MDFGFSNTHVLLLFVHIHCYFCTFCMGECYNVHVPCMSPQSLEAENTLELLLFPFKVTHHSSLLNKGDLIFLGLEIVMNSFLHT